jgi:hypothetical protein
MQIIVGLLAFLNVDAGEVTEYCCFYHHSVLFGFSFDTTSFLNSHKKRVNDLIANTSY